MILKSNILILVFKFMINTVFIEKVVKNELSEINKRVLGEIRRIKTKKQQLIDAHILGGDVQNEELPRWLSDKEPACQCRRHKRLGFDPWVRKMPCRRKWQPTPVFWPRNSHGQRSLA